MSFDRSNQVGQLICGRFDSHSVTVIFWPIPESPPSVLATLVS